jgi:hypothetical protein
MGITSLPDGAADTVDRRIGDGQVLYTRNAHHHRAQCPALIGASDRLWNIPLRQRTACGCGRRTPQSGIQNTRQTAQPGANAFARAPDIPLHHPPQVLMNPWEHFSRSVVLCCVGCYTQAFVAVAHGLWLPRTTLVDLGHSVGKCIIPFPQPTYKCAHSLK